MKNKLKKIYFILSPIIFFIGLVTYFIFGLIPITCNIQSNIECFNNLPNFVRGFYYNLIFDDYHRNLYDDIAEIIFSLGLLNLIYAVNLSITNKIHLFTKISCSFLIFITLFLIYNRINTEIVNYNLNQVTFLIINKDDSSYTDICDFEVLNACNSNNKTICKVELNSQRKLVYDGLTYVLIIKTNEGICNLKTFKLIIDNQIGYWQQMPNLKELLNFHIN